MIFVLHGDDLNASYSRLKSILLKYPKHQKIRLADKNTKEDLINALFTKDIFATEKILVCENFLIEKKITKDIARKIPPDVNVIFWEQKQITAESLSIVKQYAQIEVFKPQPQIFWFLDSISPSSQKTLLALAKVENPDGINLIYHLANRVLLLILAKLETPIALAQKIIDRPVADWQWARFQNQARLFNLPTLQKIYSGTLKIDSMIKNGTTNLDPSTLISVLFIKYLSSSPS